jgi:WD40 repeat protein
MKIHRLEYPIFAVGYLDEEGIILVAGGGGSTKSGIPNGLTAFDYQNGSLEKVGSLTTGSKAAMSLAVHPREFSLVMGVGERCWLVNVDWDEEKRAEGDRKVMLGLTRAIRSEFSSEQLSRTEEEFGYQVEIINNR